MIHASQSRIHAIIGSEFGIRLSVSQTRSSSSPGQYPAASSGQASADSPDKSCCSGAPSRTASAGTTASGLLKTSLPLIAWIYGTWSFAVLFGLLALSALLIAGVVLFLPKTRIARSPVVPASDKYIPAD